MIRNSTASVVAVVVALFGIIGLGAHSRLAPGTGLVVETVEIGSEAKKSGIVPGDTLISWSRSAQEGSVAAQGSFRTPFDARTFDIEQLPLGNAKVVFVHNGKERTATLLAGFFGTSVRPAFSEGDLAAYTAGRSAEAVDPAKTWASWQPVIDRLTAKRDLATATWLLTQAGSAYARGCIGQGRRRPTVRSGRFGGARRWLPARPLVGGFAEDP
jgi:hypothetical protein